MELFISILRKLGSGEHNTLFMNQSVFCFPLGLRQIILKAFKVVITAALRIPVFVKLALVYWHSALTPNLNSVALIFKFALH